MYLARRPTAAKVSPTSASANARPGRPTRDLGQADLDRRDRLAGDGVGQAAGDGLDFGQLGHFSSEPPTGPRAVALPAGAATNAPAERGTVSLRRLKHGHVFDQTAER